MSKFFFGLAFIFFLIGLILFGAEHLHIKLFHLPGDIIIKKGNFVFFFPITTSIILSILISLLFSILK